MSSFNLKIESVGPIKNADLTFGDLTVFVGPQATGKSISLQLFRLMVDRGYVIQELKRHGLDWSKKVPEFLDVYLGEGMRGIWREGTSRITFQDKVVDLKSAVAGKKRKTEEQLFYIPAQRVLTLRNGWPRPFTDYAPGDPFAVREFSEKLRHLMESEFSQAQTGSLFPRQQRIRKDFRDLITESIFSKLTLEIDKMHSQKRLILKNSSTGDSLPFMVWSAGQREFVPLLLGFYWLMPAGSTPRRDEIRWVVIEEIEMGLHPRAISVLLLIVLELLKRGYRICLSTHSQHVLDVVWALNVIRKYQGKASDVLDIFDVQKNPNLSKMAECFLSKSTNVYYFDTDGMTHDISELDPSAADQAEANWGGLAEFSGRVADVVARVVSSSPGASIK